VPYRYDNIGTVYGRYRRADPRILEQIERALGDAASVINIGAGTGVYEPVGRRLLAIEPSEVMIAQRPAHAASVVRGVAEALPVCDGSFDAALATFSVHHWSDPTGGLHEMGRVADHQVILTFDQGDDWLDQFWLTRDYIPKEQFRGSLFSGLDQVVEVLEPVRVEVVSVPADCQDGFFCAYWQRPDAYLDPGVRASISALALLDDDLIRSGLAHLDQDLRSGAWLDRNNDLLKLDTYDYGYRLVIA
jgi:SAM-dependent methyltransferase